MSSNQSEIDDDQLISSEPKLYRLLKLIIFFVLLIPSICLNSFIIFKSIRSSQIRSRIGNHSILFLILISFVDITVDLPMTIEYLVKGLVKPSKSSFCLFWIWINFTLQLLNLSLMILTSIQRHFLIFSSHLFQTRTGLIRYHYFPFLFSFVYISFFYFSTIFIYQCQNHFDYLSFLCGTICYNSVVWLSTYDWLCHMLIPSILIPFLTFGLLIRVLKQMKKVHRTTIWKSMRKLTLQLLILSSLYLLFWFPLSLVSLIRIYIYSDFLTDWTLFYFNYTPYLVQLLIPYFSYLSLCELWSKSNRIRPTDIQTFPNGFN